MSFLGNSFPREKREKASEGGESLRAYPVWGLLGDSIKHHQDLGSGVSLCFFLVSHLNKPGNVCLLVHLAFATQVTLTISPGNKWMDKKMNERSKFHDKERKPVVHSVCTYLWALAFSLFCC